MEDDAKQAEIETKEFKKEEVEIFFPDDLKKGAYANTIVITHTSEEFILDFLSVAPRGGSVVARIFITPTHMKRLVKAVANNFEKYEQKFGEVPEKIEPKD